MAFVIVEPAIVAALLAAAAPAPNSPAARPPAVPNCSAGQASTASFDCCLYLARWSAPASTTHTTPAPSSSDVAADQEEGR
ncbi:hypothetical protein [Croceicoccus sp. BE223]|uniref:hypothetical protein n=1 Tax=Croceicoccus sp. BE223 TaxID=2817716 RepID=UPI0028569568|nr:hypothetical protein [Croceicoccus sp. BE223]MDR7103964.1 hypothetical protein [Croceicoccus sp. BE223]